MGFLAVDNLQTWIDIIQLPIFTVIITSLLTLSGALITQWIGSSKAEKIQQLKLSHESELERKRKELDSLREMQKAMYTYYESHTQIESYFLLMGRDVLKEGYSFNLKNNLTPKDLSLDLKAGQDWRIFQNIYNFGTPDVFDQLISTIEYKRDLISRLSNIFFEQNRELSEVKNILDILREQGIKGDRIFRKYEKSLSEYVKVNL